MDLSARSGRSRRQGTVIMAANSSHQSNGNRSCAGGFWRLLVLDLALPRDGCEYDLAHQEATKDGQMVTINR